MAVPLSAIVKGRVTGTMTPRAAFAVLLLALGYGGCSRSNKPPASTQYARMASLDQYLMDRSEEVTMARSAAPESISRDADVWVLGAHGYDRAAHGTNGFACLVERSWMSPFDFGEFWNPKMRGPICFNPPAARSILPLTFKRTELVLAGMSKAQIVDSIKAFVANGLPALEPGGMAYMMSRQGYLNDAAGHWVPHLMFYVPLTAGLTWGADLHDSPVMTNPQFQGAPEPVSVFMIAAGAWSDGSHVGSRAP